MTKYLNIIGDKHVGAISTNSQPNLMALFLYITHDHLNNSWQLELSGIQLEEYHKFISYALVIRW